MDQRPKPHLIKNGIRIQCNTENFVPIVVPGLSTISSSSFPSSTSMTPSKQEMDHPTSSSSSSSSPTMTSSTVSSDSGTDSDPVSVSSKHVERKERGDPFSKPTKKIKTKKKNEDHEKERCDPLCADIPEWLQEFRENLVDESVPDHRDSHASSSHGSFFEPQRKLASGKHSIHSLP